MNTKLAGKSDTSHSHAWSAITGKPTSFTPSSHTHDDRYYTETEVNNKLAGKSDTSHNHDDRYYTEAEINKMISLNGGKISCYKTSSNFEISFDAGDGKNTVVFRLDMSTGKIYEVHRYNGTWTGASEI